MKNKDTALIIYPVGGYGTYFEWCLSYFSGEISNSDSPLISETGSAHKFWGHPLDFPARLSTYGPCMTTEEYINSDLNYVFARTHANCYTESAQIYADKYSGSFKHIIHLRNNKSVSLEVILNGLHKVLIREKALEIFYESAGVTPSDAVWEQREKISFFIEGPYNHYDKDRGDFTSKNTIDIPISRLKDEFKQVLQEVFDTVGVSIDPARAQYLDATLADWKLKQKFLGIDQKCMRFAQAAINGEDFEWNELATLPLNTIIEAYIQMVLRDLHGLEIRCYNLNVFPTNAKDLRELLINVQPV